MATSPLGGIASIGQTVASTRLGKTPAPAPAEGVGDSFGQSLMNLVENVEHYPPVDCLVYDLRTEDGPA